MPDRWAFSHHALSRAATAVAQLQHLTQHNTEVTSEQVGIKSDRSAL